jgi:hypothetical protein
MRYRDPSHSKSRTKTASRSVKRGLWYAPEGLCEPGSGRSLTRQEAITIICERVQRSLRDVQACRLMQLFYIQAEDLTEAGLDYETVCALARGFLLNDWSAA